MVPVCLFIPWREPLAAFEPLAFDDGAALLLGSGDHPLARWSFALPAPMERIEWSEGDPNEPFTALRAAQSAIGTHAPPPHLPFAGGWVGHLCYELGRAFERLPPTEGHRNGWPDLWLGLYDTVACFDRESKTAWVASWGLDANLRPDQHLARTRATSFAQKLGHAASDPFLANPARIRPVQTRCDVEEAAQRTIAYVRAGDVFQANVSQLFSGTLAESDDPWTFFKRLSLQSPAPFAAYLRWNDRAIVSQSPERFLSVSASGRVETRPIKGTRPRGRTPVEDRQNADDLLSSAKDRAENVMIVDLMRNDLARVCRAGTVKVPRLCGLESFSTLHHLVSDVTGQLRHGLDAVDLLAASFPPGSVTGAPKVRAMEIIAELENQPRGPYCGSTIALGFDGSLDSNVAIRTAACVRDGAGWRVSFRVGGGIVADSDPSAEADETLVKARALMAALHGDADEVAA